jgi:hypothetical protein
MSQARSDVVRAALWGLAAGLFLGGLSLLALAGHAYLVGADCAGLSAVECALERESAVELGRRQAVAGAALAVLGVAARLWLRTLRRPSAA